jgi:hypothetical protein
MVGKQKDVCPPYPAKRLAKIFVVVNPEWWANKKTFAHPTRLTYRQNGNTSKSIGIVFFVKNI